MDIGQEISGEHVALRNGYAYVTTKGLQILDISDPASPVMVGATEVGLFGVSWSIKGIAVDEGIAGSGYKLVFNVEKGGGQYVFHLHLHLIGGWDREE